jgi:hypothetical protein
MAWHPLSWSENNCRGKLEAHWSPSLKARNDPGTGCQSIDFTVVSSLNPIVVHGWGSLFSPPHCVPRGLVQPTSSYQDIHQLSRFTKGSATVGPELARLQELGQLLGLGVSFFCSKTTYLVGTASVVAARHASSAACIEVDESMIEGDRYLKLGGLNKGVVIR